jgi:hypothetical protein
MTPRSLWTVLIKMFGLLILSDALMVIPSAFNSGVMIGQSFAPDGLGATVVGLFVVIATTSLYVFAIWFFLFNTEAIIDKLSLDKHFQEDRFEINLKSSTAIQIAVIIIGGLIIVDGLPSFCRQAFQFYQEKSVFKESPTVTWLIFHGLETLIGYLLVTNSTLVTSWVEKNEKK